MNRGMTRVAALLLGAALPGTLAAAGPIVLAQGVPYVHGPSGLSVPAVLDGIARSGAEDFHPEPSLDVASQFQNPEGSEFVSVFFFRSVLGTPEIWFDRAQTAISSNERLNRPAAVVAQAFAPPGAAVPLGLRAVYPLQGLALRSTAVAMVPLDGWLVVVRTTSSTLDEAEINARLDRIVGQIGWPSFAKARAARPVAACAQTLKADKPAKMRGGDPMLSAMLSGSVAFANKNPAEERAGHWCRDATRIDSAGLYRDDDGRQSYIIAMGDSGSGFLVEPSLASLVTGGGKGWTTSFVQLDRSYIFPDFDRLPPPQQVIDLLQKGKPISEVKTWPNGEQRINLRGQ